MQIWCNAIARLKIITLDTVEEYAHATEITAERGCLRCGEPACTKCRESRYAIEQIAERERAGSEERVAIVRERLPDFE